MKNIHILPTDKPSRLCYDRDDTLLFAPNEGFTYGDGKQHLYITSNQEDINENDYIITQDGRLVQISYLLSKDLEGASKVILTTDQDLIADGVQAIDDEFLEWFVKNPSCESVEVVHHEVSLVIDDTIYKIIIPQEEPKQESCCTPVGQIKRYVDCIGCDKKPKQECECKRAYINVLSGICSLCWNEIFPDEKEEVKEADLLEPKQEPAFPQVNIIDEWLNEHGDPETTKQVEREAEELMKNKETIEEVCDKVLNYLYPNCKKEMSNLQYTNAIMSLKYIAEWQAERMYSHEQVLTILEQFIEHPTKPGYKRSDVVDFIKKFKQQDNGKYKI